MAAETGAQGWWYGVRSWKVWAQGFGSGWTGIMGYGAMYWTPLIVHYILAGKLGPGTTKRNLNRQGAPPCACMAGGPLGVSVQCRGRGALGVSVRCRGRGALGVPVQCRGGAARWSGHAVVAL